VAGIEAERRAQVQFPGIAARGFIEPAQAVVDRALEAPHVHPANALVQRELAVMLKHGGMSPQQAAQPVQRNGQIPDPEIAFGIRPQAFPKLAGCDIPPTESDQRFEQSERSLFRLAIRFPLLFTETGCPSIATLNRPSM
jgi:hypothetical protein